MSLRPASSTPRAAARRRRRRRCSEPSLRTSRRCHSVPAGVVARGAYRSQRRSLPTIGDASRGWRAFVPSSGRHCPWFRTDQIPRSRVANGSGGFLPSLATAKARSTCCSSCRPWRSWPPSCSIRSSTASCSACTTPRASTSTAFVGLEHYARALLGDAVFHRSLLNTVLFTGAAVVLQTGLGLLLAVLVADVKRGTGASSRSCSSRPSSSPRSRSARSGSSCTRRTSGSRRRSGRPSGSTRRPSRRSRRPTRRCGRSWPPSCGGSPASRWSSTWRPSGRSRASTTSTPSLEGAGRFQQFRRITWPLLWPQTFALVLLTTLGTLRIFDMVWIMTAGGPSHATETVATDIYVTAFRFLEVGYAQAMAMILLVVILLLTIVEYRILEPPRRGGERVTALRRIRWSTVAPRRARRGLAVPGGLDAGERGQVERRHLSGAVGPAVAAGHREHRRGVEPRTARRSRWRTPPTSPR